MTITQGYKAFNGYVFTESDAKNYNESYCKNDDERHRLFCNIIGIYKKSQAIAEAKGE